LTLSPPQNLARRKAKAPNQQPLCKELADASRERGTQTLSTALRMERRSDAHDLQESIGVITTACADCQTPRSEISMPLERCSVRVVLLPDRVSSSKRDSAPQ
jgi:hypothetical protein